MLSDSDLDLLNAAVENANRTSDPSRIVGRTRLVWKQRRSVLVSTVWLPWADDYEDMPAWETMVVGDHHLLPHPMNTITELSGRYNSHEEAATGHRAWCRMVAGWLCHAGRHTVTWKEMTTW